MYGTGSGLAGLGVSGSLLVTGFNVTGVIVLGIAVVFVLGTIRGLIPRKRS
jgi:hypothetical protein